MNSRGQNDNLQFGLLTKKLKPNNYLSLEFPDCPPVGLPRLAIAAAPLHHCLGGNSTNQLRNFAASFLAYRGIISVVSLFLTITNLRGENNIYNSAC
jgi:hypothetical protein